VPRPRDVERRDELLAAVVDAFARGGLGGRSLRELAAAVGTSHRMLIHHFGSRDALLVAVVQEVEARQARVLETLDAAPADRLLQLWNHLSDPALRSFERLFFECYARGANGEAPFDQLVPHAVDSWLGATGEPAAVDDPALARLALAVVRGLLLDLVATGATTETTQAVERFVALLRGDEAPGDRPAASPGPRAR
jgi:AcrR family transcriptional regulator